MGVDMRYARAYVSDAYPGKRWKTRVEHMPDKQILAIYFRLVNEAGKKSNTIKKV